MGRLKTIQDNFNRIMLRAKNYHRIHIGWRIIIMRKIQAAITKSSEIVLVAIFSYRWSLKPVNVYLFDEPPSWIILHGALLVLFSKFQDLIFQAEDFFPGQPSWSRQWVRSPLPRGHCSWRVARLIWRGEGGAGSPHIWFCIADCKPWTCCYRRGVSIKHW